MSPYVVLVVALIAFATALFTTPYVRRLALNVGMLDATGERRMHDQPKPRIGGIAVYLGFAFALFSALGYLIKTGQFGATGHLHDDLANFHGSIEKPTPGMSSRSSRVSRLSMCGPEPWRSRGSIECPVR